MSLNGDFWKCYGMLRKEEAKTAALTSEVKRLNDLVEQLQGKAAFKCGKEDGLRLALSILWGGTEKQACIELIVGHLKGDAK
jgi:hypothetical protein